MSGASNQTPTSKVVGTLTAAGVLAGLLLVVLFSWANPLIQSHASKETSLALNEVLSAPAKIVPLYIDKGALVDAPPRGTDSTTADRVFAAYDAAGKLVSFGMIAVEPGFSELLTVAFGYDPVSKMLIGMKVLDSKETPGIADAIVTDTFAKRFQNRAVPLNGTKVGRSNGDKHDVDMISGATISSRALIGAINHRLDKLAPVIDAYMKGLKN